MDRRRFLKYAGTAAVAAGASAVGLESFTNFQNTKPPPKTAPVTITTTETETATTTNVVTPAWVASASLRAAAESMGLLVGAAAFSGFTWNFSGHGLLESKYADTLTREFNFLTPEDEMQWLEIEEFGFGPADALVDFATANHMKVTGHALVHAFNEELPKRINEQMSSDQLRLAVQDHIRSEVKHFRGRVYAWNVVNSVMDETGLRRTLFLEKLGEGYIAEAFRLAHETDPDALLFYNEAWAEGLGGKSDLVYAFVRKLLASGVPIHGVGLQMHISASDHPSISDIEANVRRLTALGLKVNISEMDVRIHDAPGTMNDKLELQRKVYHDVIAACVKVKGFTGVTFWGFTDAYSWITRPNSPSGWDWHDAPDLLDVYYNPKPAYWGALAAVSGN